MGREAGLRLELFALDMEASIAFYTLVLVFELVRHEPGDYASLRLGDVVLGIGPVAKLPEEGGRRCPASEPIPPSNVTAHSGHWSGVLVYPSVGIGLQRRASLLSV
jgi:catechol 2,3-dioxygenase-like lactoylglutathione lyase family enzyme